MLALDTGARDPPPDRPMDTSDKSAFKQNNIEFNMC